MGGRSRTVGKSGGTIQKIGDRDDEDRDDEKADDFHFLRVIAGDGENTPLWKGAAFPIGDAGSATRLRIRRRDAVELGEALAELDFLPLDGFG